MTPFLRTSFGNVTGAFADAAVLIPLVVLLSVTTGQGAAPFLVTAGLAYLAAAAIFRVPMSVQPLKSIALASIALGATSMEIRASGFLLGLIFLGLTLSPRCSEWADRVPRSIIHGMQFSLGILLLIQGMKSAAPLSPGLQLMGTLLVLLLILIPRVARIPVLGLTALLGIFHGSGMDPMPPVPISPPAELRLPLLFSLLLPQIALTSANSILGTRDAARAYFGSAADRVTPRRLSLSIGAGNLLSASFGGLPFCHGSGGVTAHYRGGATHWSMNIVAGVAFLAIAGWTSMRGGLNLHPLLIASLLTVTGIYHLDLTRPLLHSPFFRTQLITATALILTTQNLLHALASITLLETLRWTVRTRRSPPSSSLMPSAREISR